MYRFQPNDGQSISYKQISLRAATVSSGRPNYFRFNSGGVSICFMLTKRFAVTTNKVGRHFFFFFEGLGVEHIFMPRLSGEYHLKSGAAGDRSSL